MGHHSVGVGKALRERVTSNAYQFLSGKMSLFVSLPDRPVCLGIS